MPFHLRLHTLDAGARRALDLHEKPEAEEEKDLGGTQATASLKKFKLLFFFLSVLLPTLDPVQRTGPR